MIIIGEKINGAIPSVAKAIAERDSEFIRSLAVSQAEAGSSYIDICASVEDRIELETLQWLIGLAEEAADVPIAVDSPNAAVCAQAVKFCSRPGLINSVSCEGNKIDIVFPAIAQTEWGCVALLCDDSGIPATAEKRLEIFEKIIDRAKEFDIDPSRLYIDPLVEMLCTSDNGINMILEVISEIKDRYPSVHVTGAVSNVSFNLPARKVINQGFVLYAMQAGLDSAIFDPLNKDMTGMIYASEALLGKDRRCLKYIKAHRKGLFGSAKK